MQLPAPQPSEPGIKADAGSEINSMAMVKNTFSKMASWCLVMVSSGILTVPGVAVQAWFL